MSGGLFVVVGLVSHRSCVAQDLCLVGLIAGGLMTCRSYRIGLMSLHHYFHVWSSIPQVRKIFRL